MVTYDNTNLDQIAELLDKCVENFRKVFEPLRVGPYFPHREEFNTDSEQIKRALGIYKGFDLHESTENLNDRQLHKNFEKEIVYNLSSFTGRQETYYHVIVRKFLVKIRSVEGEVIKYSQTCNIIHNIAISDSVWGTEAATLYDNLNIDIEEVLGATSTLHHILQPYLIPYYDEDFKVAIEGKGSTDYFAPSLLPYQTVQQPEPIEPESTEPGATDLNVKILLAYQSGILDGTFNRLPQEKQYSILSLLFGKSKANVKNALTALYGDANTEKNPKNLPSIVEKTNNLITKKDLGIPLVVSRQK